jgi:hypothetical protein
MSRCQVFPARREKSVRCSALLLVVRVSSGQAPPMRTHRGSLGWPTPHHEPWRGGHATERCLSRVLRAHV